jgi:hypothetical protein
MSKSLKKRLKHAITPPGLPGGPKTLGQKLLGGGGGGGRPPPGIGPQLSAAQAAAGAAPGAGPVTGWIPGMPQPNTMGPMDMPAQSMGGVRPNTMGIQEQEAMAPQLSGQAMGNPNGPQPTLGPGLSGRVPPPAGIPRQQGQMNPAMMAVLARLRGGGGGQPM